MGIVVSVGLGRSLGHLALGRRFQCIGNLYPDTRLEILDSHTVRMIFPEPDGAILGKFRGFHLPSTRFWDEIGFGYKKLGTGEGHW